MRPECGSNNGYQHHLRHQTEPCQPCRDAHAEHMAQQRRQRPPVKRCDCGTRITKTVHDRCASCRYGKRAPKDNDDLVAETVIVWENVDGVMRAVTIEDPIPDGPPRALVRMFEGLS